MRRLQCHQLELQQRIDDREVEHMQQALAVQSDIEQNFKEQSLTLVGISKSQVAVESKLNALLSIMANQPVTTSTISSQVEPMASHCKNGVMHCPPPEGMTLSNDQSLSAFCTTKVSDTGSSYCSCHKRIRQFRTTLPLSVSFFWETTMYHLPQCPLYVRNQDSTAIGIRFLIGKATHMVEAALRWGAVFIAPHITIRNVVAKDSPAFRIVEKLGTFLFRETHRAGRPVNLGSSLTLTLKSLVKLFREHRASPFDVKTSGSTLFHVGSSVLRFRLKKAD